VRTVRKSHCRKFLFVLFVVALFGAFGLTTQVRRRTRAKGPADAGPLRSR